MKPLLILGGGGHAAVVSDAARAMGWVITGCLDDAPAPSAEDTLGPTRLGGVEDLAAVIHRLPAGTAAHAAVGDPAVRRAWTARIGGETGPDGEPVEVATVIHPSAVLSPAAVIGDGAFVGPGAIINAGARIGPGAIVNSRAIVEHDCDVGAFAHIAPGATLAGGVTVGPDALVGLNATVLPGIRIGAGATLGAGGVATTDIPDGARAVGVPARPR